MTNYSFWKLINEHCIEIPIIQRDYAQGRSTQKSKEVRMSFVKSIINATKENNGFLHLNFIYGKVRGRKDMKQIEENKKAIISMLKAVKGYSKSLELDFKYQWDDASTQDSNINETSFLPLDGQQRLTTLFLFHWYLLKQIRAQENVMNKLLNFTYQIRPSTKQFCKELVLQKIRINEDETISNVVSDSNWFFKYWLKDPSVNGMLIMLDEIHEQCKTLTQDDFINMWESIATKNSINFELLDLDEFELTDELYVKMNARGKALTSFENFKSWLIEYIEDSRFNINIVDWKHKLDTSWADLFWDNKDGENMLIDEEYFVYFRNMMQFHYILFHTVDIKTDEGKSNREISTTLAPARKKKKDSDYYHEYPIISGSKIKQYKVLSEKNLIEIFQILELISMHKKETNCEVYEMIKPIFSNFITGNITMPDRVMFYGLGQYLLHNNTTVKRESLQIFLRVLGNLIRNTEIDDISTVKSIIKGFIKDRQYYSDFSNSNNKLNFTGFRADQVYEEKLKMQLRLKENTNWNILINKAEEHKYFQGQIGFLLHLTGIDSYYDEYINIEFSLEENNKFEQEFKEYLAVANQIFKNTEIDKESNNLMYQALLTYDDYLIHSATYRSFPKTDKHRDNSWYRFMREFKLDSKYNKIWKTLESLMHDLKSGKTLEDIVINIPTDWRECFVKYSETIDRCGDYKHFRVESGNIYLLSKDTKRSNYTELETFHLLKSKFESNINDYAPFNNADYYMGNTKNGDPCVYLYEYEINGLNVELNIYHYGNKEYPWEIYILVDDNDISELDNILGSILNSNKFTYEAESEKFYIPVYTLKISGTIIDLDNTIRKICSEFNNINLGD